MYADKHLKKCGINWIMDNFNVDNVIGPHTINNICCYLYDDVKRVKGDCYNFNNFLDYCKNISDEIIYTSDFICINDPRLIMGEWIGETSEESLKNHSIEEAIIAIAEILWEVMVEYAYK